jgi:hypothetical protein
VPKLAFGISALSEKVDSVCAERSFSACWLARLRKTTSGLPSQAARGTLGGRVLALILRKSDLPAFTQKSMDQGTVLSSNVVTGIDDFVVQ